MFHGLAVTELSARYPQRANTPLLLAPITFFVTKVSNMAKVYGVLVALR